MVNEIQIILADLIAMGVRGDDLEDHFVAIASAFNVNIEYVRSKYAQILETPKRY